MIYYIMYDIVIYHIIPDKIYDIIYDMTFRD